MAKKFKPKKPERYQAIGFRPSKKLVITLAILISVGLVGSTVVAGVSAMFSGGVGGTRTFEAAITEYRSAVDKDPNNVGLRTQLGHTIFEYGNNLYSQGMTDYVEGVNGNNTKRIEEGEAVLQQADKYFKEARVEYEAVLKEDSKNIAVIGNLASIYYYIGEVDLAIETARKGLEIDPEFHVLRANLGTQFLASGKQDYTGAIEELEKIPSSSSEYQRAQETIANIENLLLKEK